MSEYFSTQSKPLVPGGYITSLPEHKDYLVTKSNDNLKKRSPEKNTDLNDNTNYEKCMPSTVYEKKLKVQGFTGFNQSNIINNHVNGTMGGYNNTMNLPRFLNQSNIGNQVIERIDQGPPTFLSNLITNPLNLPKPQACFNKNTHDTSFNKN